MYDRALIQEILGQIHDAAITVLKRFEEIKSADDLLQDDAGLEKLDAICMKLIAIGESLKNVDKLTDRTLLGSNNSIDWKKAIGMRDIITHHYFDLDAEVVYDVCKNHLKPLAEAVENIRSNISKSGL